MGWTCDPDLNDVMDAALDKPDWVYIALIDRSEMERGDIQLGRYPGPEEAGDDPLEDRKERALAWLRGRVNQRIATADRKSMLKLRVRGFATKGMSSVFSQTFNVRFEGEPVTARNDTPLASEARELVDVMLDGMRGLVTTAGALMSQMGTQLLDERRQHADLQRAVAESSGIEHDRKSRAAVATRFLDTLDGAVKVVAADAHPVLANPKIRALLEKKDVIEALSDDKTVDEVLQAVEMMAVARRHALNPRLPAPQPSQSEAVRLLQTELERDRGLAVLLNTPEGADALITTLRHLADSIKENDDEPVPA